MNTNKQINEQNFYEIRQGRTSFNESQPESNIWLRSPTVTDGRCSFGGGPLPRQERSPRQRSASLGFIEVGLYQPRPTKSSPDFLTYENFRTVRLSASSTFL